MKKFILQLLYKVKEIFYKTSIHNKDISIICNDCCGGCIYHDIGQRFLSPTINLYMNTEDYFKYIQNLYNYNMVELIPKRSDEQYPIGILKSENLNPIEIHFVHYKNFEEAKLKWDERKKRINYNKLLFLFHVNEEDTKILDNFLNLNLNNAYVITYTCFKSTEKYINDNRVLKIKHLGKHKPGEILNRYGILRKRYLEDINYIKLLNTLK